MQSVIWDLMLADQFLMGYIVSKDSSVDKKIESIKLYQRVFTMNDISKESFQKSYAFYQAHPSLLQRIMDTLSKRTDIIPTIISSKPIKDSVKGRINVPLLDSTQLMEKMKKRLLRRKLTTNQ
jgi:hypothetical protein